MAELKRDPHSIKMKMQTLNIKKLTPAVMLALLIAFPETAYAAEIKYFEFGTVFSSNSITAAEVSAPSGHFKPLNDFISGVDVWLDNPGVAGTLTINLRKVSSNELLASKPVEVPNIPYVWGGKRVHAKFSSAVPVASTNEYKIDLITSAPDVRIYYSDLVDIQQHDSSYTLNQAVLPSYLGLDEQSFAFKFALYEDNDTSNPVVTSAAASVLSPAETEISFHANEPVDSRVLFAPSGQTLQNGTAFKGFYTQCNSGLDPCKTKITTEPDISYDYRIVAKDEWGNESSSNGAFVSLKGPEEPNKVEIGPGVQEALAISNARITSVYSNSVSVAWSTSVAANSNILVSKVTGSAVQVVTGAVDNTYELEHLLTTSAALTPKTNYIAKITSIALNGNDATYELSFVTAESAVLPPEDKKTGPEDATNTTSAGKEEASVEKASEITVTVDTSGDSATVSLGWNAPEGGAPSDGYRIDIFDADNNLALSLTSETNSIDIEGLAPGNYKAIVYSNNAGFFEKIGDPVYFSVPGLDKPFSQYMQLVVVFAAAIVLLIMSLALTTIRRKRFVLEKVKKKKRTSNQAGFTLVEIMVSIGILTGGIVLIGLFARNVSDIGIDFTQRFKAEQEIRLTIGEAIAELRSVAQSHEGSYPISMAGTSTLTFYVDLQNDGKIERVRYFLSGQTLKKGIISPSGDPLTYNPANETIKDVVHNVVTGTSSIFSYYDSDYTGDEPPMTIPVVISDIRMVEINISAKDTGQISQTSFSTRVTPRNLRD